MHIMAWAFCHEFFWNCLFRRDWPIGFFSVWQELFVMKFYWNCLFQRDWAIGFFSAAHSCVQIAATCVLFPHAAWISQRKTFIYNTNDSLLTQSVSHLQLSFLCALFGYSWFLKFVCISPRYQCIILKSTQLMRRSV